MSPPSTRPPALAVTVIGGGTGSYNVLTGLKQQRHLDLRSIVSMVDSGGDSGRLRDEFGVLPPGDIRRCLVALSEESKLLRDLFSFRFSEAPLEGRSFGNLFFLALTRTLGSEEASIDAISKILKIRGKAIAVTWDHSHLYAELADGSVVAGEANIDVPKHDPNIGIRRVYLEPVATANPAALAAIRSSDFVVLAPGDLYTSTIPNLLVRGISEALRATQAPLIYVLNLMTKYGETTGYTASEHVERIAEYCGRTPDAVLYHNGHIPQALMEKYQAEEAHPVRVDVARLREIGVKLLHAGDVMSATSFVRHNPTSVARELGVVFDKLMNHELLAVP